MGKTARRHLLGLLSSVTAVPALAGRVGAQTAGIQARPIRLLVGFAPGGGNDVTARIGLPVRQRSTKLSGTCMQ
jgi:tripartite-type tricarboxylate transporter receptor subunit TctC